MTDRPVPTPTPETRDYWEGAARGELWLQRCTACRSIYFPPRPFCPECSSRAVKSFAASGRGRLYSYVISHLTEPGFETPYAVAVVELEEGPRLMSNILNCPQTPDASNLDMPLEVVLELIDDEIVLPQFRPAEPVS